MNRYSSNIHKAPRVLWKILFLLLFCALLCACVAEGADQSASYGDSSSAAESVQSTVPSKDESSSLSESHSPESEDNESFGEMSAESSESVPEPPTYTEPEETDTELSLVGKFDVGMGKMFEYAICCSRTAKPAEILTPIVHGADAEGNVYVFWELGVIRLNDGAKLKYNSHYTEAQMLFWNDELYLLFTDNSVQRFSLENGFENAVLTDTYTLKDPDGRTGWLLSTDNGPVWISSCGKTYTLDGKSASVSLPTTEGELKWMGKDGYAVSENQFTTHNIFAIESLYTAYDMEGNTLARFLMKETQDGTVHGYKMPYKYGQIKYYHGWEIQIGETVFEKAVNATLVFGEGVVYAVVYFPEHGEIYRITPGYSDVSLSAFTEKEPSMKNAGIFLNISRAKAKANALEMIETLWTIKEAHLDPTYKTIIPYYLRNAVGQETMGIPYCRGGYNGHSYFGNDSFAERVKDSILDGFYYTTGNVNPDVGHQHYTIGLDCSAFVCAAWEFIDSGSGWNVPDFHWTSPDGLTKYGHKVSSVYDLKEMDILIRPGDNAHVMFFACLGPNNTIGVYEVTSLLLPEKTVFRYIDISRLQGYTFLHPYQSYGQDENGHWLQCDSCHGEIKKSKPHTYENGVCTACGYKA